MRAKVLGGLLALFMLCAPVAALCEVLYVAGQTPDAMGRTRVALRERPVASGEPMLRVYTNVPVEVAGAAKDGFIPVRLGALDGYIMETFLTQAPDGGEAGAIGYVDALGEESLWMYQLPDEAAERVPLENGSLVRVLAIGEDWHYVASMEEDGGSGFVAANVITEMGAFRYAMAKSITGREVVLRAGPSEDAEVIARYDGGRGFVVMFSPGVHAGWEKVRTGFDVGYVWLEDLAYEGM